MDTVKRVQYVLMDVVGFTRDRPAEAQGDILTTLNGCVVAAASSARLGRDDVIYVPNGDSIAVCIIEPRAVDAHLAFALEVLQRLHAEREGQVDELRKFQVRIGINENYDNILTDINGNRCVAGVGVVMAQRIMGLADAGQIMVGRAVFEVLSGRERYMKLFKRYDAQGKHGLSFPVYQFVSESYAGLDVAEPLVFRRSVPERRRLDVFVAHYMGQSLQNQESLIEFRADPMLSYSAVVLLAFRAEDAVGEARIRIIDEPGHKKTRAGSTFGAQYNYYRGVDFWVVADLSRAIKDRHLARHEDCFTDDRCLFISAEGRRRLLDEQPDVARFYGVVD